MIERYYTYTVSHCSKAIRYGFYWLINELNRQGSEKGFIFAVAKGNFCNMSTRVYKEGLGLNFVRKLCKNGFVRINGKIIELQYPRNINASSFTSILVIYPNKKIIDNIENSLGFYHHNDRLHLPPNSNTLQKSILIIPWIEFAVDEWIDRYNPHRININCVEDYKFGSCRRL